MKNFSLLFLLVCTLSGLSGQDTLSVPLNADAWRFQGKSDGAQLANREMEINGRKFQTLEITIDPSVTPRVSLYYLFRSALDIRKYTDYSFMIRSGLRLESEMLDFRFMESNWKGSSGRPVTKSAKVFWAGLPLTQRVSLLPEKFYTASGDMATVRLNLPSCLAMRVSFQFNLTGVKTDKPLKFQVADLRFFTQKDRYSGQTAAWDRFIENYKPDYSDGSKYLLPPETGRMQEPFPVVKDGKAAAEIVYTGDGSEPECVATAAKELQDAVLQITGVKIPVISGWNAVNRKTGRNKIVLGKRAYADCEVLKKLSGTDGFAVKRDGDKLYVYGIEGKGTMNGVYALIENNTDLIWARPHREFGTVFSKRKDLEFLWGNDIVDVPDSRTRGWNGYQDLEWMARNRCNSFYGGAGGDISWTNAKKRQFGIHVTRHYFGHNIGHFIPAKQYYAEHPEYFSLIEFKDKKTKQTSLQRKPWNQYCFSNPEAKRIFTENALDMLRRAPEKIDLLTVDMDDTLNSCLCDQCMKPLALPDGTVVDSGDIAFRSTQYFLFLNDVMQAVNKEFPEMKIKTLAYFWTVIPPKCEVNPNIIPEFAVYPRPNDKAPLYHPENRMYLGWLEGWAKKSKTIDVYNYHGLGLEFPRPLSEPNAEDFKLFHKYTRGMSSEYPHNGDRDAKGGSAKIWDYSAMEFWVQTRLYWNPSQNVEQLRKYYIARTFREAAPPMEKFYGLIREAWLKSPARSGIGASGAGSTKTYVIETGLEEKLRACLDDAATQVKHPVSAELVKRVRDRFEEYLAQAKTPKKKK